LGKKGASLGIGERDDPFNIKSVKSNPAPNRYSCISIKLSNIRDSEKYGFMKQKDRFYNVNAMKNTPGPA